MSISRIRHGGTRRDFLASALKQILESDRSGANLIPSDFKIVSMDDDLIVYSTDDSPESPEESIKNLQNSLTSELGYSVRIKRFSDRRY